MYEDVPLYGNSKLFPIAIERKPLNAQNFSKRVGKGPFFFGLDPENIVQELRRLADDIEKRSVVLQEINVKSVAAHDDFVMTHITIVVAEGSGPLP